MSSLPEEDIADAEYHKVIERRVEELSEKPRAVEVLRVIAKSVEPLNKYRIWEAVKSKKIGTEPTFLYLVDNLKERGLIKIVKTDEYARGQKPSHYYDLTLPGLAKLMLDMRGTDVEGFRELAKKYRQLLPRIFGAWPEIVKLGTEEHVITHLGSLCLNFYPEDGETERMVQDILFPTDVEIGAIRRSKILREIATQTLRKTIQEREEMIRELKAEQQRYKEELKAIESES